jgi:hypothetical protein
VKICIASHIIAPLHMNCEGRYKMLYMVHSIYEDIYYVVVLL